MYLPAQDPDREARIVAHTARVQADLAILPRRTTSRCSLDDSQVRDIRRRLASGEGIGPIAARHACSREIISGIKHGRRYKHVKEVA